MTNKLEAPPTLEATRRGGWRRSAGVVLFLHGAIHLLGAWWAFGFGDVEGLGGPTLLATGQEPGAPVMVAFGLLWLAAAAGLISAGAMVALGLRRAARVACASAGVSLIPTVVWWNDAWIGALVSGVVILSAVLARHHPLQAATTR